jgi:hypothetical protein
VILNDCTLRFWARTTLHVWPEQYVLVSLTPDLLPETASLAGAVSGKFAALVMERDEVSLTIEKEMWLASSLRPKAVAENGPFRAITLDVNVDLGVVGYLAPAALALADAGVSIIPQCACLKDHLLVHEKDVERAIETLNEFIHRSQHPG